MKNLSKQKVIDENLVETNDKKQKTKKKILIFFLITLFVLSVYQSFRTYYAPIKDTNEATPVIINEQTTQEDTSPSSNQAPATTSNKQTSQSTSTKNQASPPSQDTTTPATPAPVNNSEEDEKNKIIDYFIEIALAYQGVERWIDDFNVGYAPGALDSDLETCLDGFIRDFNNASSTSKLHKNREEANIKIYVVTPEQMVEYGGEDVNRGFAFLYKNADNQDYKAEIFLTNALPDDQKAKCYLIKHEMMHAVGFRGHSDLFWEGIMAVPSANRNTENLMSDVDTKAIEMLYNIGLPLKSTRDDARSFVTANYPQ